MGWMGRMDQLTYALEIAGADRDEDGRFIIHGEPVVTFMGMGDEAVVGQNTDYCVGGKRANLAGLMNSTSYGLRKITVI